MLALLLACAGSQGEDCAETDSMSCPATVKASTTVGVSLMQVGKARVKPQAREVPQQTGASAGHVPRRTQIGKASTGMSAVGYSKEALQAEGRSSSEHLPQHLTKAPATRPLIALLSFILILVLAAVYFYMTRPVVTMKASTQNELSPHIITYQRIPLAPPSPTRSRSPFPSPTLSAVKIPYRSSDRKHDRQEMAVAKAEVSDHVVPESCECFFVVPARITNGYSSIYDLNGQVVLYASTRSSSCPWRLELLTTTGESVTECVEGGRPSAANVWKTGVTSLEFKITAAKAEFSARLVQVNSTNGQQRFQLILETGDKLHFWGNFKTQAVNVTDDQGNFVATTEPFCGVDFDEPGAYYRLRVANRVNVCQPLCGLLCINRILNRSV